MVGRLVILALLSAAGAAADAPAVDSETPLVKDGQLDLDAVVKHFEDLYRSDSSISDAELTVVRPRTERSLRMKVWTSGKEKALVLVEEPAREKGTATLKVDKNLWNYMPKIKKTVRIPPSMMLAPWMGSDFTNDDLVRESSYEEDYTYAVDGRSEDPAGWQIRFDAKADTVGLWKRLEVIMSEDGRIPLLARFYDQKDRHARTIHWDDVKILGGRRLPARMTLIPEDIPENKTVMVYHAIDFDVDVPEDTFSLSRLEQVR